LVQELEFPQVLELVLAQGQVSSREPELVPSLVLEQVLVSERSLHPVVERPFRQAPQPSLEPQQLHQQQDHHQQPVPLEV